MKELTSKKELEAGKVLLDFYATWCGPCKLQEPILAAFAAAREEITVLKVNVDSELGEELTNTYKVRGVPTLIAIRDGLEVSRKVGPTQLAQLSNMV